MKIIKVDNIIKGFSKEQIQKYSEELINVLRNEVDKEAQYIEDYVEHLKRLNSGIEREELAKKIISRGALKAGGIGAVLNVGGIITMPITMPADLYLTFRIQARMVLAIAYLYGWDIHDKEITTDVLLVMGGSGAVETLAKAGIKVGQEFAKKAMNKYINREVMKKINQVISRKLITKNGEKSLTSFFKLGPIIGAPIGGGINLIGTKVIGESALKYYKG
ncbi:MAG TPA: hypothetical protein DCP90_02060 [Clostridiales bacterium]|nr:MAG: hypothetical protein A2Y22_08600 [Clostridiales bacterium GWD2_32_59]HAN09378.1 hypothetical protein [Clostridiales bacterium]